jgi:hypothetical protein
MTPQHAIYDATLAAFDISSLKEDVRGQVFAIADWMTRPSVLYRPALSLDGNMWCALYGDNLQDGCAGFGETPEKAMEAFDKAWRTEAAPKGAK